MAVLRYSARAASAEEPVERHGGGALAGEIELEVIPRVPAVGPTNSTRRTVSPGESVPRLVAVDGLSSSAPMVVSSVGSPGAGVTATLRRNVARVPAGTVTRIVYVPAAAVPVTPSGRCPGDWT